MITVWLTMPVANGGFEHAEAIIGMVNTIKPANLVTELNTFWNDISASINRRIVG
jgi:hypothetical protein